MPAQGWEKAKATQTYLLMSVAQPMANHFALRTSSKPQVMFSCLFTVVERKFKMLSSLLYNKFIQEGYTEDEAIQRANDPFLIAKVLKEGVEGFRHREVHRRKSRVLFPIHQRYMTMCLRVARADYR